MFWICMFFKRFVEELKESKKRFKILNILLFDVLLFNGCNLKWKLKDFFFNVIGFMESFKIENMK